MKLIQSFRPPHINRTTGGQQHLIRLQTMNDKENQLYKAFDKTITKEINLNHINDIILTTHKLTTTAWINEYPTRG